MPRGIMLAMNGGVSLLFGCVSPRPFKDKICDEPEGDRLKRRQLESRSAETDFCLLAGLDNDCRTPAGMAGTDLGPRHAAWIDAR